MSTFSASKITTIYLLLLICITTFFPVTINAKPMQFSVKNIVGAKNLYAEHVVATLVIATANEGMTSKSICIHNNYFGAPQSASLVINKATENPDNHAASVLTLLFFNILCRDGEDKPLVLDSLWEVADASKKGFSDWGANTTGYSADASIMALISFKAKFNKKTEKNCIKAAYKDGRLIQAISKNIDKTLLYPIPYATYKASQELCNFPKTKKNNALIFKMQRVANERILTSQDIDRCSQDNSNLSDKKKCIDSAFDTRNKLLHETALAKNTRQLKKVNKNIRQMKEAAWRLPDGRIIFRERKRNVWRFEDNTVVPHNLVKQRRPPKKDEK